MCRATELISELRAEDHAAGDERLYSVILLSDGADSSPGWKGDDEMFADCLPQGPEADGARIHAIAFGADADQVMLGRIASVAGGSFWTTDDETTIEQVYRRISAEQ